MGANSRLGAYSNKYGISLALGLGQTVVTRMDTSKSGWTPYVYYTTVYSTPRHTIFRRIYWARELLEIIVRGSCARKRGIQALAPKYSD